MLPAVDPDVAAATTLDPAFYLDPGCYDAARERIFARSWQWLGELDDVAEPASLAPRTLLPGLLDEPLLLARDAAGTLRCLSNVCTHRGNLLVHEPGRADAIRCGYHSRRFDLAGRMTFMPGFDGARDFPSARDDLPQLELALLPPALAFASIAPAAPFDAFAGALRAQLDRLWPDPLQRDDSRDRDYLLDAHWALYVENYLEGLHIPYVHPALARSVGAGYRYELHRFAVLQTADARDGEPAFEPAPGDAPRIAAYYWWLFPNLMSNCYPWGLSLNVVEPLGPARTRVRFRAWVADRSKLDSGAGGALDEVELQDEAVVQAVQRGIRSRLYRGGRYSPLHERGVHRFHRLVVEFMSAADGSDRPTARAAACPPARCPG